MNRTRLWVQQSGTAGSKYGVPFSGPDFAPLL
jgi:hypothetical protein